MSATSTLSTILLIDQTIVQVKVAHEAAESVYKSFEGLYEHFTAVTKERDLTEREQLAFSRLETAIDSYAALLEILVG